MYALLIFAVALAVRLIHIWQLKGSPFFDTLLGDANGYDLWAQRLAGGDWIGSEVFYQAPLYPYFLGVVYALFDRDLLIVRVVQAVIGSASCVLLGLAGARLFSRPVGLAAGLALALWAPAIFFDGLLQKSVLDMFFMCLALWLIAADPFGTGIGGQGVGRPGRGDGRALADARERAAAGRGHLRLESDRCAVATVERRRLQPSLSKACWLRRRPDPGPVAGRRAQLLRRRRLLPHDLAVRLQLLHRQQPERRRHLRVDSLRPRLAGVRADRCHRGGAGSHRAHALPCRGLELLDRARDGLHHLRTRRLAAADGPQGAAAVQPRRDDRHRKPGELRRVLHAAVAARLDRSLRAAGAAGGARHDRDLAGSAAVVDHLRAVACLRGERGDVLRVRALSVSAGAVPVAVCCGWLANRSTRSSVRFDRGCSLRVLENGSWARRSWSLPFSRTGRCCRRR